MNFVINRYPGRCARTSQLTGQLEYHLIQGIKAERTIRVLPNRIYRELQIVWMASRQITWEPYEQIEMDCPVLVEEFWSAFHQCETDEWIRAGKPSTWCWSH